MEKELAERIWDSCNVGYEPPLPRGIRRAGFDGFDEAAVNAAWQVVSKIPADSDADRRTEWVRIMEVAE